MRAWPCALSIASLLVLGAGARGETLAEFYAAHKVTLIVGSDAGGGYDALARLTARHLGKFIPGNPTIVVQNMPGAGSINAANYLYNTAPKDGSFIGLIQRTLLSANLTNQKGVRFDVQKVAWVGNLATELPLFLSWHTSPVKTVQDLFQREMVMGGGGPTSDSEVQARLLNALIGTRIKIVSGYPGQAQIQLAMERGEVEAVGGWSWSNLKSRNAAYVAEKKVNILLQGALKRDPELAHVPTPFEFVKSEADRKVLEVFYAQQLVARPLLAPPETPPDRLAALRKGFDGMTADAEFTHDAERLKIETNASSYKSIDEVIRIISATPPDIAAAYAKLNNPPE